MTELRGMTWQHPRGYAPLQRLSQLFKERHPDVDIVWDCRSLKDFGDYPVHMLAQKYDLIMIDHPHVGICSSQGVLVPLDEWVEREFLDDQARYSIGPSHFSYQWDGKQWALAADAAAQVAAYRPDLLSGCALPRYWHEVIILAKSLGAGQRVGWPLCSTDAMCSFLSLCANIGGHQFFDEEHGVPFKVGEEALEVLFKLLPVLHSDSLYMNPIQMYDRMVQSDEIAYVPLAFGYSNYSRRGVGEKILQFGNIPSVSGLPQGGLLGGVGIAVSALSNHIPLAVEFAKHIVSPDVQRNEYFDGGGQPGHAGAWRDPRVNMESSNFFKGTIDTLESSYMRPRNRAFPEFQEQAGFLLHEKLVQAAGGANLQAKELITSMNEIYSDAVRR
ncbi:extracellular solute-binding protein [Paenibacillus periandrae]|uniref:extracellular solute-binding protein n=1 Tax=Paenibacillus periandrae TaxID=1761741 RepID=UPI001F088950|nr:extracellular solute-binding protein [Paenibacillus periandrae]